MKRRVEEAVKTDNSGGYPSGPISPPRHTPRTLATGKNIYVFINCLKIGCFL